MELTVDRRVYTRLSTTGELSIEGVRNCYTLEPPRQIDGSKPRLIDAGRYRLTIRWSWKHKRQLPHVENVPDFTAVEIHVGNGPDDTDGCTLVGQVLGPGPDWIGHSTDAFTKLFASLLASAQLRNPGAKEQDLVYDAGWVTYVDQ